MRFLWCLAILFLTACAARPRFHDEIRAANRQLESDFNRGDYQAVAHAYADDAMLVGPGGRVVSGRGAIDEYWVHPWVNARWALTVRGVEGTAEMPVQRGRSILRYDRDGKPVVSDVEFLLLWRRDESARYRITLDAYWRTNEAGGK